MADYISREAAIKAFENADADACEQYPDGFCDWGFGPKNVLETLQKIPAADVEPVRHGRWIIRRGQDWPEWAIRIVCSECGLVTGEKSKYCPNCGAKMDLEEEP